jgi:hypothetical protein
MSVKGDLLLDFFDVYGDRPDDRLDVTLTHTVLGSTVQVREVRGTRRLRIRDLDSTHDGSYRVLAFPMRRRPVSRFVRILDGKTVRQPIVLPIDPERIFKTEFPAFESCAADLQDVLSKSALEGMDGHPAGASTYSALDELRKAGLLNLYTKMKATRFPGGSDTFSYVTNITRLRGDRFFARVAKELRDEVKNSLASGVFHEVSGKLHTPPPGFVSADSFKTVERYGNLQITFFCKPDTLEFLADIDIDDAQGIEHIFQVVRNRLSGGETHPYDIHEILLQHQRLDPGYRLIA